MNGSSIDVVLYGTAGCHLCEEAEALLRLASGRLPSGLNWTHVDIADDAALMERYGVRIPVVYHQGRGAELGWPFDAAQLAAFLVGMDST